MAHPLKKMYQIKHLQSSISMWRVLISQCYITLVLLWYTSATRFFHLQK